VHAFHVCKHSKREMTCFVASQVCDMFTGVISTKGRLLAPPCQIVQKMNENPLSITFQLVHGEDA